MSSPGGTFSPPQRFVQASKARQARLKEQQRLRQIHAAQQPQQLENGGLVDGGGSDAGGGGGDSTDDLLHQQHHHPLMPQQQQQHMSLITPSSPSPPSSAAAISPHVNPGSAATQSQPIPIQRTSPPPPGQQGPGSVLGPGGALASSFSTTANNLSSSLPTSSPSKHHQQLGLTPPSVSKTVSQISKLEQARLERRARQAKLKTHMAGLDQSERDLAIFTRMLNEVTKKYSLLMQGGGGVGVAAAAAMGDDGQQQHEFLQSQEQRRASLSMLSREAAKIIVCVRKRPLNEREKMTRNFDIVSTKTNSYPFAHLYIHEPKIKLDMSRAIDTHKFVFDHVFDELASNNDVYQGVVSGLVDSMFQGGHVTLFAYGQTGSGKTHTIFGSDSDMGLYQSTCQDIIRRLEQEKADEDETLSRKRMASSSSTSSTSNIISAFATSRTSPTPSSAVLTVQFFEIYSSRVYDLFNNRKRLDLLEDGKGYVQVVGLREIEVDSLAKFVELVEIGRRVRTTGVTEANSTSSRSHAVFQITIYQDESRMAGSSVDRRKYVTSQGIEMRLKGQFSFVDLAGSERGKETGNINRQARMEGAEINKSLLALKECIRALHRQTTAPSSSTNSTSPNISTISSSASPHLDVSGGGSSFGEYYLTSEPFQQQQQRQHHIPFRGSKLTQILRDSFTGRNSKTVMIATVGPGSNSAEHTLNTLRYADRVKELEKKGVNNGNSGGGSKRSKSSYVSRDDDDGMLFLVDDDERNRSSASGGREGKGFGGGVSTAAVTTTRSNSRRDKDVAIVGGRRSKHSSSLSRKNESSSGGGGGSVTVTSGITSGLNMRKSASAVSSSQDQIPGDDSSNTTTGSSSSSSEGHSEADDERPDGRDKEELLLDDEEADAVDYDDEEEEEVEEEEEEDSPLERHHEDDFAHHHSPQQQQQHILSSFDTGGGIISSSPNNKGHSKKDSSGGSSSFSSSSVGATFIKNQQQQQQQQQLLVQGRESLKRSALGGIRKDTERILLESHSKSVSTVLGLLNEEEEALRSVLRGWTSVEEYVGTLRSLLQRRTDETNTLLSLIN